MKRIHIIIYMLLLSIFLAGCNKNISSDLLDLDKYDVVDVLSFQYSSHSTKDIILYDIPIEFDILLYNENKKLDSFNNLIQKSDTNYYINHLYLSTLNTSTLNFYITYNTNVWDITIHFFDHSSPYIITNPEIKLSNVNDIYFQFDLFGGFIDKVNGVDITENDYDIFNDLLIIHKDYLSSFQDNEFPLVINYVLNSNDIVMGIIVITI